MEVTFEEFKSVMSGHMGKVAQFFKPAQVQTMYDFLATIREDEHKEIVDGLNKKSSS